MDEVIFVDKPAGISSFGVVARVRRVLSERLVGDEMGIDGGGNGASGGKKRRVKVGHTGTLDPFATGLMILLAGKATKRAGEFSGMDKVYEATMKLGEVSTTGDPEGEITEYRSDNIVFSENGAGVGASSRATAMSSSQLSLQFAKSPRSAMLSELNSKFPTEARLREVFAEFKGKIRQRPPVFSAIKINGQRAYKLARAGKMPEMPEREVTVYDLELLEYAAPLVRFRASVSSGTYIRSLAVDMGERLGVGAYVTELRRLSVGEYKLGEVELFSLPE